MAKCDCIACGGLAAKYGDDVELLGHYRRQLLKRGWAGRVDDVEKAYQKAHTEWANRDGSVALQNARQSA